MRPGLSIVFRILTAGNKSAAAMNAVSDQLTLRQRLMATSILYLTLRLRLIATSIVYLTLSPRLMATSILYLTLRPRLNLT